MKAMRHVSVLHWLPIASCMRFSTVSYLYEHTQQTSTATTEPSLNSINVGA
jgi:hypothetical protein